MSHPDPSNSGNNYPSDHYKPGGKVLSPKKKRGDGGAVGKLEHMARRLKGLQETKHFGSSRRSRHKMAQRIAKGEDIF